MQKPSASGEPSVKQNKENDNDDIDDLLDFSPDTLKLLLRETEKGKSIIEKAELGVLSERRQLELAEIVATWHLAHRTKLHECDLKKYSRVIVLLFKNEKQVILWLVCYRDMGTRVLEDEKSQISHL